ncbi:hypothetical protein LCGC14_2246630, partial [marine sediment metagenome]
QILHFNYFIYNSIVIYSAPLFEYYARNDIYSIHKVACPLFIFNS